MTVTKTPPDTTITVACQCGGVSMSLTGEPAARALCHCNACRDFYGSPILAATAWAPSQISMTGTIQTFAHPSRKMTRRFCADCGETLHGTNRLEMYVVPNALLARAHDAALPASLQPTMHLFYRHRVLDVQDDLPKYLDGWDGPRYGE
ncbi:aldehyde-activating protein [Pandoraea fibrosis]|uniref:Aldehyde-activating protein n=1 Tax=Pandoraea fibrosis TaxID=1891094 RepID=A0ABX6HPL2_9BURK|nr:GFA family protein [Pandoraea fibrosis]QHE93948.1 aldehyde-activating protein [Pandoraea fibrosis]QHF12489.1 aldehyde-activating protein [Pandoraea fibrosis]